MILTLTASAFVAPPRHPSLDVDVVVNGRAVDHWSFDVASLTRRQARIPAAVVAARRELDIEFRLRNSDAPM